MRYSLDDLRAVAVAHRRARLARKVATGRPDPGFAAAWETYLDRHPEIHRNDPEQRARAGGVVAQLICEAVRRSGQWVYGGAAGGPGYVTGPALTVQPDAQQARLSRGS